MSDATPTVTEEPVKHPNPLEMDPLGNNTIKRPDPVVTDADKERFFKQFLKDEPYYEEVSLFDNQFKVTFKGLTIDDQNSFFNQINLDKKNNADMSSLAYGTTMQFYRLAASLVDINGEPFAKDVVVTPEDTQNGVGLLKKKAALFDKLPTAKLYVLNNAFSEFERKVEFLSREVFTPNFWKAAK